MVKETTLGETIKEKANIAKEKIGDVYGGVKSKSSELCNQSGEFIKDRAKVVDDKVHNNPWPVVGGAFVTGILLGYILGRK